MLSNLSAPVPCVLSNFRCKLVKSNSSLKIIITLKVFNLLTSSHGISLLASQECCLHSVLFTRRYVTFVLVIITFVFTLYNVVVLEKNRTRSTIFKSILEQLRKIFDRTTRQATVWHLLFGSCHGIGYFFVVSPAKIFSKNHSPILFFTKSNLLAAFFYKNVAFWVRSSRKIIKSEM